MESESGRDELIVEGIVVTVDADGTPNIAPMGPRVDRAISRLVLKPFQTATTYRNLKTTGCGVFHVTDDVLLIAQAAIGTIAQPPELTPLLSFDCPRLADTCRWWAFRAASIDDTAERTTIDCEIVQAGEVRPFFGFNRAKHAVLEAAIWATRIGIVPAEEIRREVDRLSLTVEKTAGEQEQAAFALLRDFLRQRLGA